MWGGLMGGKGVVEGWGGDGVDKGRGGGEDDEC